MKIVFVVHYFPPLNSTGSRRVLALIKYLSRMGHAVTVITTRKSHYDGQLTETVPDCCGVIELGKEPVLSALQRRERPVWVKGLVSVRRKLTMILGQLVDHRILFALDFMFDHLPSSAREALQTADVIVSSTPPWPVHLATYFASRRYNKPWVADYRDQFSGNHIHPGNLFSRRIEFRLDRKFVRQAAAVTVVSSPMREYYLAFADNNVTTIENGYDEELFARLRDSVQPRSEPKEKVVIRYLGTIYRIDSIPRSFFQALRELVSNGEMPGNKSLAVEFYGNNDALKKFIGSEFPDLIGVVTIFGEIPYPEALAKMQSADALLMIETSAQGTPSARGILTTKLFEYLAAKRPIVADISPDTLIGEVITQSGLGLVCSTDSNEIGTALTSLLTGEYALSPNLEFIATFSREAQAKRFERLLLACL